MILPADSFFICAYLYSMYKLLKKCKRIIIENLKIYGDSSQSIRMCILDYFIHHTHYRFEKLLKGGIF